MSTTATANTTSSATLHHAMGFVAVSSGSTPSPPPLGYPAVTRRVLSTTCGSMLMTPSAVEDEAPVTVDEAGGPQVVRDG